MSKTRKEFLDQFDVILDAEDPNFSEDLMKALDLKDGEPIEIITPQFTRTDDFVIGYIPKTQEEYAALPKMTPDNLKKIGCQVWDNENGKIHWLYPYEWYDHIPNGTEIVDISGNVEQFERGVTDNDMRFGALAYGFVQDTPTPTRDAGA